MTATHTIKINGKWYRAGDELPSDRTPRVAPVEPSLTTLGEPEKVGLTREEIEAMPYPIILPICKEHGIDTTRKKATALREELIKKLGL